MSFLGIVLKQNAVTKETKFSLIYSPYQFLNSLLNDIFDLDVV